MFSGTDPELLAEGPREVERVCVTRLAGYFFYAQGGGGEQIPGAAKARARAEGSGRDAEILAE